AMIDFLFGRPVTIRSTAPDETRRSQIESVVHQILTNNGGSTFLQHLALLGSVYGFVDVLVKLDPTKLTQSEAGPVSRAPAAEELTAPPPLDDPQNQAAGDEPSHSPNSLPARIAQAIRLEVVEPARALPILSPSDWRDLRAYVQVYKVPKSK